MTLVPITLPPGMMRNGTPYGAKGRWYEGNLVRWHDGALRPIGGWQRRKDDGVNVAAIVSDPSTETVRDMIAYQTNSGFPQIIFGSNSGLYRLDNGNNLTSLTATGFTAGSNGPSETFGYGIGPYGAAAYGTARNLGGDTVTPAQRWNFDTWGENVLAAGVDNGPVFEITPSLAPAALTNAPEDVAGIITTDQRIVMVIKNDSTDIRQVIWSDRENNNVWTPAIDNFAGDQKLQGTGRLVGIYKVLNQILILSESDAQIGRYLGAPLVYGFESVGEQCGPIHHKAVATTDRFAIWMGDRNFWVYDGTLKPLPCEVMDYLAETMSYDNVSKIHCQTIAEFSEIWWFYQSNDGTEVDSYVTYNYVTNHWATGELSRTTGCDANPYRYPVMVDADGLIFDHEQSGVKVTGTAYATTGPLELGNGDANMAVRYIFPDTEVQDSVELTMYTRQMPTDTDREHGPFAYRNPISTTGVLGREVRMKVTGIISDWEVGNSMRFDVQKVGGGFR